MKQEKAPHWSEGYVQTDAGKVLRAKSWLSLRDKIGAWKVRWAIARDRYTVPTGLYAVGDPTRDAHVFVSANYKMSFDHLRQALDGHDCWILVIDTQGINVWCAAGKGTFSTKSIAEQVSATQLKEVVSHKRLILPQLGAAGVSAQKAAKTTGFHITYGPVRAKDIKAFLAADLEATEEMRTVKFSLHDRLILAPVEMVTSFKYIFLGLSAALLLSGLDRSGYSSDRAIAATPLLTLVMLSAWIAGSVVGPTLLPFLPGRSFALKGAGAGVIAVAFLSGIGALESLPAFTIPAWSLIVVATSSFLTMNFTGCSTYTSPSGVRHEMRVAVPTQAAMLLIGSIVFIASLFTEAL